MARTAALLAAAFLVSMIATRVFGVLFLSPNDAFINENVIVGPGEAERPLVVVMHGYRSAATSMRDLMIGAREVYPNADFLAPSYHAGVATNVSLDKIAKRLGVAIDGVYAPARHNKIVMIGHSNGALILRKAYLQQLGAESDAQNSRRVSSWVSPCGPGDQPARENWACAVDRFVLMAGISAGLDRRRPWYIWPGFKIAEIWGIGRFAASTEKGGPEVSDLRIDWLTLSNAARRRDDAQNGFEMPDVIMLRGDQDGIIKRLDNDDMSASGRDFAFIEVRAANHNNIVQLGRCPPVRINPDVAFSSWQAFDDCDLDEKRSSVFSERAGRYREALSLDMDELLARYPNTLFREIEGDRSVTHIVYLVNGIRTYGEWRDGYATAIGAMRGGGVVARKFNYERLPMLSFLLFNNRDAYVRQFIDQYTHDLAKYPNVQKISFIGNSNGTYILARALEKYDAPTFDNVYFSGSVVRYTFPWKDLLDSGRIRRLRNDASTRDWIVAWFPGFYQQVASTGLVAEDGFFNLGTAGFNGFRAQDDRILTVGYVPGGHGSPIKAAGNRETIIRFILNDEMTPPEIDLAERPNKLIQIGSQLAWLIMAALLGLFFSLAWFVKSLAKPFGPRNQALALAGYFVIMLVFLNTY